MSENSDKPRLHFASEDEYRLLQSALVRERDGREHAAFLFASRAAGGDFKVIDVEVLGAADFVAQSVGYLELRDGALQEMIVRAHEMGAALVEAHSHPFMNGRLVHFSPFDCTGLAMVGPHVSWRLPGRPYIALVFGPDAFDSLYWEGRGKAPRGAVDLLVAGELLRASRESERAWRAARG